MRFQFLSWLRGDIKSALSFKPDKTPDKAMAKGASLYGLTAAISRRS